MVSLSLMGLEDGIMSSRNTTTPKPPIKWVEALQKRSDLGSASTSERMLAPVVVKPDTLSNQAFITLKGPPQSTYGSIPKTKDSNHDRTMIT